MVTTEHGTSIRTYTIGLFDLKTFDSLAKPLPIAATTKTHTIGILDLKTHDALATPTPVTPATDDLGLVGNTFGTTPAVVQTSDAKATTVTQYSRFQYPLPADYEAGSAITMRLNCEMVTTVSDTTAVVDAEIYTVDEPSTDICATAATTINSLTAADVDFALTETNLAAGDVLDIRLKIVITDGATGTAVLGQINKVQFIITEAAAADDLRLVDGSYGTTAAAIQTSDSQSVSTTQKCRFQYELPAEYEAGSAITLRANCEMVTTVSDTSATIDASIYTVDEPSTDIIATVATTFNSLTAADIDFALTETNLAAGDVLDILLTIAIVDGATGTVVIGQINKVQMLITTKDT